MPNELDYVDEWMRKNLEPAMVDFITRRCTSFVRWDLMRHLAVNRTDGTAESFASALGVGAETARSELDCLTSLGLVVQRRRTCQTTYRLKRSSPLSRVLHSAVRSFENSDEFRFALVYTIVRRSCTES